MPNAGDRLGKFKLVRKVGTGGNSHVWEATTPSGETFAIKVLKHQLSPKMLERFRREVQVLRDHPEIPGIMRIIEHSEIADSSELAWYVMPKAVPLRDYLAGSAVVEQVCDGCAQVAETLARLHVLGISHRDVKPDNLFWLDGRWTIGDFGLVDCPNAKDITATQDKVGPQWYIAPEMINGGGENDGRSADVYSLGKVLWVLLLNAKLPISGPHDPRHGEYALRGQLAHKAAAELDELVRRMTHPNPVKRPSAADCARELRAVCNGTTATTAAGIKVRTSFRGLIAAQQADGEDRATLLTKALDVYRDFAGALHKVCKDIAEATGLTFGTRFELPEYLELAKYPPFGSRSLSTNSLQQWARVNGTPYQYRLTVFVTTNLRDDGTLRMACGYLIDRYMEDQCVNAGGMRHPWTGRESAAVGSPTCVAAQATLLAQLSAEAESAVALLEEYVQAQE